MYRFQLTANQLYCTVILYRCTVPLYCTVDHQLCCSLSGSCWLIMSEASCTAVLRALLANTGDLTDDAAIVLVTGPLLVWSSYIRVPSAQNNRNIRLEAISEIMLYYRNVAVTFYCYAAAAADLAEPVNNTCRRRPFAANHYSNPIFEPDS